MLLGNTRQSRRLARKLYKEHGVVSYIADRKRPPFCNLHFSYTFFHVADAALADMLADELLYLFSSEPACVYATAPMTEEYSRFLNEYGDRLEAACIIREPDTLFSHIPFINNEDGGHGNEAFRPSCEN